MMPGKVLITGAGGYVGYQIARRYLSHSDKEVLMWLRASDRAGFETRIRAWRARLARYASRLSFSWGDLTDEEPFARVDTRDVGTIVHCAANTRFNIAADDATRINIQGTARTLAFADRCENLECIALVSTVYAAGLLVGAVPEQPLAHPDKGFANHYERSKWASENLLTAEYSHLPWRIFRTATIVSDDERGLVSQYNVIHKTLRLMYTGLLPIFPGLADLPIYFVTGDHVARGLVTAMEAGGDRRVFNLSASREQACTLSEWLTWSYDNFLRHEAFQRRSFMRPMMTDLTTFRALARSVETFSRDVALKAVVQLVGPFAEQMFQPKDVETAGTERVIGGEPLPDMQALLSRICDYLADSGWGQEERRDDPDLVGLHWDV